MLDRTELLAHSGERAPARIEPQRAAAPLVRRDAVHEHAAAAQGDALSGQPDDALHVARARMLEHDDVAALKRSQLVDEQLIAGLERRQHRLRRDFEGFECEAANRDRDEHGRCQRCGAAQARRAQRGARQSGRVH